MNDVLIVSAARLPIGRFGGALKEVSDWDLGTIAIAEAMKRAGLRGDEIDEVIMAHGFRTGDLPANSSRAVALKAGIPVETMVEVLKTTGAASRVLETRGPNILKGDYNAHFMMKLIFKDMGLALDTAAGDSIPMPISGLVRQIYAQAIVDGRGEDDYSAVLATAEKLSKVNPKR